MVLAGAHPDAVFFSSIESCAVPGAAFDLRLSGTTAVSAAEARFSSVKMSRANRSATPKATSDEILSFIISQIIQMLQAKGELTRHRRLCE